jgi:hypothetical protein
VSLLAQARDLLANCLEQELLRLRRCWSIPTGGSRAGGPIKQLAAVLHHLAHLIGVGYQLLQQRQRLLDPVVGDERRELVQCILRGCRLDELLVSIVGRGYTINGGNTAQPDRRQYCTSCPASPLRTGERTRAQVSVLGLTSSPRMALSQPVPLVGTGLPLRPAAQQSPQRSAPGRLSPHARLPVGRQPSSGPRVPAVLSVPS